MIIDLTPVRDGTGPARLLDMVEGRSKAVFKTWLAQRDPVWRQGLQVVAMDGFTGFKTAPPRELPDAVAVMDPFHVVHLAGDALDRCRRRVQQDLHGHRSRSHDPLYRPRRTLHTGADLLTDKQRARLEALFEVEDHIEVEATWGIYQRMIGAYRPTATANRGRELMTDLIAAVSSGVPKDLTEIIHLGRTLKQRADDVLAYFDRPGTSNGPTEAIQRTTRTPTRLSPRLSQPHPLHRQISARDRRVPGPTTPSIVKSRLRTLGPAGGLCSPSISRPLPR